MPARETTCGADGRSDEQAAIVTATIEPILETSPDAVFILDPDWRFRFLNARARALLPDTASVPLGTVIWEIFPEVLGSPFEEHYRRAVASGRPVEFEA